MSAERRAWGCALVGVALALSQGASARDWVDVPGTPFTDPLRTRPPQLDSGALLPGDTQPPSCEGVGYDAARPLSLSEVIDLALCHNPQLQATWAGIKVQAAQLGEARAAYLPTLNIGVNRLNQKTRYPEAQSQANTERTSDAQFASLTWRLLDFGGRAANHRAADAQLAAALASHDAALQRTMANVIGLYFDAQSARASVQAKAQNEALARQTLQTALKRESRGAGAQSDTLQARTSLAKGELEHARAVGTYEKSLAALGVAAGLSLATVAAQGLTLAPDYADDAPAWRQELAPWLALAQEQHPAIVAARAQLEAARQRLASARSEGLPTLDFTQSAYVNGRPNQGLSTTQTRENVVGLSLNVPLFDGFGRTYKVRGAQAQIDVKEAELRDVRNQVLGEIAKAHADALAALRTLAASQRLLDAAQEALDNVQRKYDQGVADILEMLSVQGALADAAQERVRAQAEWRSARLRLLANAGTVGLKDLRHNPVAGDDGQRDGRP